MQINKQQMAAKRGLEWNKEIRDPDKLQKRYKKYEFHIVRHINFIACQKSITPYKSSIKQNKNPALTCPQLTHANGFLNQLNYYIWTRNKGTDSSTLATLPRFENTNNYDSYYYQEYNDGNAHPFSRVLLKFLSILKCRCPSLDMIDCIVDLTFNVI